MPAVFDTWASWQHKSQKCGPVLKKAERLQLKKELEGAKMESAMEKLAKRVNARQGNQLATLMTDSQEILESKGDPR
jgi:gluconate kinase